MLDGGGMLVGATTYDATNGVAVFPLPRTAPALGGRTLELRLVASDFQEAKNIDTVGPSLMPNTRSTKVRIHIVTGMVVDWVLPSAGACLTKQYALEAAVSSTRPVTRVRFLLDGRQIAVAHRVSGIWTANASTGKTATRKHTLIAVATDAKGDTVSARRGVRNARGSRKALEPGGVNENRSGE